MVDTDADLLHPTEVMAALGIAQSTVYKWIHRGEFQGAVETVDGWRIPRSALDPHLARQDERARLARFADRMNRELRELYGTDEPPPEAYVQVAALLRASVDAELADAAA